MIKWSDVLAQERHYAEIRYTLERERLTQSASTEHLPAERFYWRWLARMGGWLIDLGCRLQTRAGAMRPCVESHSF